MAKDKSGGGDGAQSKSGGWGLWRSGAKKPKKASLGEESNMYYNEELKRWVERGKEHEAAQEVANAAPPKLSASSVPVAPVPRRGVHQRYVLQSNLSVSSSASSLAGAAEAAQTAPSLLPTASFSQAVPSGASSQNLDGTSAAGESSGPKFFVPGGASAVQQRKPAGFFVPTPPQSTNSWSQPADQDTRSPAVSDSPAGTEVSQKPAESSQAEVASKVSAHDAQQSSTYAYSQANGDSAAYNGWANHSEGSQQQQHKSQSENGQWSMQNDAGSRSARQSTAGVSEQHQQQHQQQQQQPDHSLQHHHHSASWDQFAGSAWQSSSPGPSHDQQQWGASLPEGVPATPPEVQADERKSSLDRSSVKRKDLFGALGSLLPTTPQLASSTAAGILSNLVGGLTPGGGGETLDFDGVMHPGGTQKLDGPLPWELPDPLKHSDQFISICSNWQKHNPGVEYSHDLLLASLTGLPPPPPPPSVVDNGALAAQLAAAATGAVSSSSRPATAAAAGAGTSTALANGSSGSHPAAATFSTASVISERHSVGGGTSSYSVEANASVSETVVVTNVEHHSKDASQQEQPTSARSATAGEAAGPAHEVQWQHASGEVHHSVQSLQSQRSVDGLGTTTATSHTPGASQVEQQQGDGSVTTSAEDGGLPVSATDAEITAVSTVQTYTFATSDGEAGVSVALQESSSTTGVVEAGGSTAFTVAETSTTTVITAAGAGEGAATGGPWGGYASEAEYYASPEYAAWYAEQQAAYYASDEYRAWYEAQQQLLQQQQQQDGEQPQQGDMEFQVVQGEDDEAAQQQQQPLEVQYDPRGMQQHVAEQQQPEQHQQQEAYGASSSDAGARASLGGAAEALTLNGDHHHGHPPVEQHSREVAPEAAEPLQGVAQELAAEVAVQGAPEGAVHLHSLGAAADISGSVQQAEEAVQQQLPSLADMPVVDTSVIDMAIFREPPPAEAQPSGPLRQEAGDSQVTHDDDHGSMSHQAVADVDAQEPAEVDIAADASLAADPCEPGAAAVLEDTVAQLVTEAISQAAAEVAAGGQQAMDLREEQQQPCAIQEGLDQQVQEQEQEQGATLLAAAHRADGTLLSSAAAMLMQLTQSHNSAAPDLNDSLLAQVHHLAQQLAAAAASGPASRSFHAAVEDQGVGVELVAGSNQQLGSAGIIASTDIVSSPTSATSPHPDSSNGSSSSSADVEQQLAAVRAEMQAAMEAQQAALKAAMQAEMEAQLAAVRAELQAQMEVQLSAVRAELTAELAAKHEASLQDMAAQLESAQAEASERATELDELMACLGMSDEKVAALSEALLASGIDPEPITARVEASYLGVDAGGPGGSDGDDGLITVSPGVGDSHADSPGSDVHPQEHAGAKGGFVYSAPSAIAFASHINGVEAAGEPWSLGQEEMDDVL